MIAPFALAQPIICQAGRSGLTMETAPGLHCAVTRAPGSGEGPRCRLRGNSPEIEACLLRTTGNDAALTCNHKFRRVQGAQLTTQASKTMLRYACVARCS